MALYIIGDTHFSSDRDKPMDVFGGKWLGYDQKLMDSIGECMKSDDDVLVICGDFSWGMNLADTLPDFRRLDSFPGKKILLKGNHDYWWETVAKMNRFFDDNGITTIEFLHNNFFEYNSKILLCGTRGWMYDNSKPSSAEDKVFKREVMRLRQSLEAASSYADGREILCFLHYPPVCRDYEISAFTDVMKEFNVRLCCYGHLHGESIRNAFTGMRGGIEYKLVSADAVDFVPVKLSE
ncbi:MAG: metallophosphoesterase [Clostridia bacterium]|nr:metallophosphoesterase [Clostridia bacterium]